MKSRVQLGVGIAVLAALMAIGIMIWVDRMQPVIISISAPVEDSMFVAVSGAVSSPGVVEVPPGARLQEVVDAAGGFREDADTTRLNLAGRVGDGEQVDIPAILDTGSESPDATATPGLIDLNTASIAELDQLPGIGEVLAGRIVDYRDTNGPFTSVDQLSEIEGISPRLVDEIRPFVTVSNGG
jgi:competence protein ComEA